MKVRELIEELKKLDGEKTIGVINYELERYEGLSIFDWKKEDYVLNRFYTENEKGYDYTIS